MNKGTKIRTVLAVLTTINTVLAVTDIAQFGNEKLNLAYKIISVIVNGLVVGINTWFDNNYTEAACEGTGYTRMLKAKAKGVDFSGVPAEVMENVGILPEGDEDGDE